MRTILKVVGTFVVPAAIAACGGGGNTVASDSNGSVASGALEPRQAATSPAHDSDATSGLDLVNAIAESAALSKVAEVKSEVLASPELVVSDDADKGIDASIGSTTTIIASPYPSAAMATGGTQTEPAAISSAGEPSTETQRAGALAAASELQLTGTGVNQQLAPGCSVSTASDFVDSPTWNNRRLLPRDCELVRFNPPLFSWRQPADRKLDVPWIFTLKRTGGDIVTNAAPMSPVLRLTQGLPAGNYQWYVSYTRKHDGKIMTSKVRSFKVASDATTFLPPIGRELAAQVAARPAPRLLAPGSSFAQIAAGIQAAGYGTPYAALLARAEELLTTSLPPEPASASTTTGTANKAMLQNTFLLARNEARAIEVLALAWRLTGEGRYRSAAVARFTNVARWSPTGTTGYVENDMANAALLTGLGRGIDLLAGGVNATDMSTAVNSVKQRVAPLMKRFRSLDYDPYDSHLIGHIRDVTEALMYAVGQPGFPEAQQWLSVSWDQLIRSIATWGDNDGSWGNGVAYGWYALDGMGDTLASIRLVTGFDLAAHPWVARFGDFLMAQTAANAGHSSSIGDGTEVSQVYQWYAPDQFRLYAAMTRKPQHEWYWRQGLANTNAKRVLSPFHFLALGLQNGPVAAAAPTRTSGLFEDAGVVAMHDSAAGTSTRSTVHFRSSRFGSYNHSLADQNSFTLISRGKDVLISGGYYPYYLSPHHATVTRATRYKNALTFDGGIGQAEPVAAPTAPGKPMMSMDTRGQIVNYGSSGAWTATTGDATLAYRGWNSTSNEWTPLLTNAVRSVAYNRQERVVLIYDWATSASPRQWELNFNALAPFSGSGSSVMTTRDGVSACIDVHVLSGSFAMTSGFAVAPERTYPTQYQARFRASTASGQFASLTVIREDCRSVSVAVAANAETIEARVAGGAPLTFNRRAVVLPVVAP